MMMMRMVVMIMGPTNRSISGQALICSNNRHLSFSQPGVIIIIIITNNNNLIIVIISIITIIFILIMRNLLTVPPPTKVAPQPVIVGEGFDKSAVRFL